MKSQQRIHAPDSLVQNSANDINAPLTAQDEPIVSWHKGAFHISTDKQLLDMDMIHNFLSHSHWAQEIDRATVEKALSHSLCFGIYRKHHQLGFCRLVTDYATFAYLSDVFISAEYRGHGLGLWLVQCCMEHPIMGGLRRIMLYTSQAPWLYSKAGFKAINEPNVVWSISRPDIYKQSSVVKAINSVH